MRRLSRWKVGVPAVRFCTGLERDNEPLVLLGATLRQAEAKGKFGTFHEVSFHQSGRTASSPTCPRSFFLDGNYRSLVRTC